MKTRLSSAVLSVALWLCVLPPAGAADPAESILASLRGATLARPLSSLSSIHTSGKIEVLGIGGTAEEWDELGPMRFTQSQDAGALTGASGWDGKSAWSQDYAGLVTIDGGERGRLQTIDQAYLDNLGYLRADRGGATVTYAGVKSDAGKSYDVLAVTPPQGSEMDLWIDRQTHLIAKLTQTISIVSVTTTFSNYRQVQGITYPFEINTQTSTGNSVSVSLARLDVNEDVSPHIGVPSSTVSDYSISGGDSTTTPLEIVNNHLYLHVMLDGQGPYTFVLDSGGDYIVTPEVASSLHAKTAGGMQLQGVGNATEGAGFTHIDSLTIGKATVRNQYMLVLPIATGFGVAEGLRVDGMVGYQLLARFVATINYAGSSLRLAMPSAGAASVPDASAMPFYFDGTIPRVPIAINGISTTAEVDTGSRAGLTLSTPFLAAHPQIAALAKTAPGVVGFGVGGPSYARLGRVPILQLGPFDVKNTVADFAVQTKGAFADPFNPANIGGAIWRRFTVTFDYAHQQLLLAKDASFDEPLAYDRSGIFLIDAKGAYTVISVMPGTPAATSGLTKGDVILAVNGAPASNDSLAGLRTLLSG
ncbi:MAG TPA: aspartyl protease family protein, partial [Xanthobacteraceae bacterium]